MVVWWLGVGGTGGGYVGKTVWAGYFTRQMDLVVCVCVCKDQCEIGDVVVCKLCRKNCTLALALGEGGDSY